MDENALTVTEQRKLKHFEQQITKGVGDVYNSLRMIHDQKLYRGTHQNFADYAWERWGIAKSKAYHLLKHGQILKLIEDKDSAIAENVLESHTREVADLPPEQGATIIVEASKKTGGKVTAKDVRETRDPFVSDDEDPFGEGTISSDRQEAPQDSSPRPPRKGEPKSGGSSKQRTPQEEFKLEKSKLIKTAEALQRAFDDVNRLRKRPEHTQAISQCKSLILMARDW